MRKLIVVVLSFLCYHSPLKAQVQEVEQLLLNVEKLAQLKGMLEDLKKGYEIVSQGYTSIKDIAEGNYRLHQVFLDGLLVVSPAVRNYKKVGKILTSQYIILQEAKINLSRFEASGLLEGDEWEYLSTVYKNLKKKSFEQIEVLAMTITDGVLRMSDDERLQRIDAIWKEVGKELTFLRDFNNETRLLLLARLKEKGDLQQLRKLHLVKE